MWKRTLLATHGPFSLSASGDINDWSALHSHSHFLPLISVTPARAALAAACRAAAAVFSIVATALCDQPQPCRSTHDTARRRSACPDFLPSSAPYVLNSAASTVATPPPSCAWQCNVSAGGTDTFCHVRLRHLHSLPISHRTQRLRDDGLAVPPATPHPSTATALRTSASSNCLQTWHRPVLAPAQCVMQPHVRRAPAAAVPSGAVA
jgi:hypothetical protein